VLRSLSQGHKPDCTPAIWLDGQRGNPDGRTSQNAAERFNMPYTYGNRLRYSGQYVLLAAVAVGRATVTKEGRSYVYSIKG
jgi:hypothetical protein